MLKSLKKNRQGGFVVATELIFLLTCMFCILIIAWGSFGAKVVAEWADLGSAIGSLDQSYSTSGMAVFHANDPVHNANNPIAIWRGSSFHDHQDFCDDGCNCGIVMCIAPHGECQTCTN